MSRKTNGNGNKSRSKKAAAIPQVPTVSAVPEVRTTELAINLDDEIRRRAYEIYLERQGNPGTENEDWLAAEREVLGRHQHYNV